MPTCQEERARNGPGFNPSWVQSKPVAEREVDFLFVGAISDQPIAEREIDFLFVGTTSDQPIAEREIDFLFVGAISDRFCYESSSK